MAVTCTVTATKIDITAGISSDDDAAVVAAVNAVSAGTITGSGTVGDPYIVTTPSSYRELEFSSGVEVTLSKKWQWGNINTTGQYAMDFAVGSNVTLDEGFEADLSAGSAAEVYIYGAGGLTISGTLGNEVVIKGYSRFYFYFRGVVDWNYITLSDNRQANRYFLYIANGTTNVPSPSVSIKNLTITNSGSAYSTGLYMVYTGNISHWILEDISINNVSRAIYALNTTFHVKNYTAYDCPNQDLFYRCGTNTVNLYETSKDDTYYPNTGIPIQPRCIIENGYWRDMDNGAYCVYCYYDSRIEFRNCEFEGDTYSGTQDGVYAGNGGRAIYTGTTTYTNMGTNKVWGGNGTHLHGHRKPIHVQDLDSVDVTNAFINIYEASGREYWSGKVDSNGDLKNCGSYQDIVVIEKEETSTGVFTNWDSHTFMATAPGYQVEQSTYDVTDETPINFTLTPLNSGATTIYDSTIIDSVIY